jgi:phage terminase large subunit-like protein
VDSRDLDAAGALRSRVVGIDGGGLDDLLGLAVLGVSADAPLAAVGARLGAPQIVLERRKEIASQLEDFAGRRPVLVDSPATTWRRSRTSSAGARCGPAAGEAAIGVDAAGIGDIVDALTAPAAGSRWMARMGKSSRCRRAGG